LVVMTPKSLLRLKAANSPLDEFIKGRFRELLDDAEVDAQRVRRVVLCSGKVYYDLLERRAEAKANDVALVRVEQFFPWHEELIQRALARYRKAKEWVWAQEESQNMGGWSFVEPRLRALGYNVEYVGRDASASPATGSLGVHRREQKELVEAAVVGSVPHLVRAGSAPRLYATESNGAASERVAAPAGK
jgi:2-oxoglutarate dehydrogenase E1 component